MSEEPVDVARIFCRDPEHDGILVLDGYGLSVTVARGHLIVRDGLGRHRRERRLPRAQRTVQRIVILGHTGMVSLEAIRWCTDTGIALLQIDTDGSVLMLATTRSRTDARLLRAQAAAPAGPVGVGIARNLLHAKITGQAAVAASLLDQPAIAHVIRRLADQLTTATTLPGCRDLEAQAANLYFSA